ncbi:MAG: hypothetical protein WCY25_06785 [Moheibacter sp.]
MMKRVIKDDLIEAGVLILIFSLIFIGSNLLYEIATVEIYTGISFAKGYLTVSGKPIGHPVAIYVLAMILSFIILTYVLHRLLGSEQKT